jgi:hypothetical protein
MDSLLTVFGNAFLPLGIAVAGAVTTIRVAGMQIRARQYERDQDRQDREKDRAHHADVSAAEVRAVVIEGIVEAFASYAEAAAESEDGRASDFRVKSQLFRLSTRCDTDHLSSACVAYVADSLRSPNPEDVLGTFADIQSRLEGWHIGHLSLDDVGELIEDGRRHVREHLRSHQIVPATPF